MLGTKVTQLPNTGNFARRTFSSCFSPLSWSQELDKLSFFFFFFFYWNSPSSFDQTPAYGTYSWPHSKHHFPASKLCQGWLCHWRDTLYLRTADPQRGQRPPKGLGTNQTVEAPQSPSTHMNMRHIRPRYLKKKEKKFCLDSNDFSFIWAGVSIAISYKRNVWYNLSCLLQSYCHLNIINFFFR